MRFPDLAAKAVAFAALAFTATIVASGMATPTISAPKVSIASLAQMPVVTRTPYDETLSPDAETAAVDAAFAKAKANGKRVLIDLGGNWCPDCIVLANFMAMPEIKAFVSKHYEVVVVDVGRYTKNLQIPGRFGMTALHAAPTVLIADADGKLVNPDDVIALNDARHMGPQAIADWLAKWAK